MKYTLSLLVFFAFFSTYLKEFPGKFCPAGGYFAAGFHGTIGHNDIWNRIDAPNHYTLV